VRAGAGPEAADAVKDLVAASFDKPRQSIVAQVAGWVAFVAGALALFSTLQDALNSVWQIEATNGGWRFMLRERLASLAMVGIVALLLLASIAAGAALTFAGSHLWVDRASGATRALLGIANGVVTFAIASLAFALVYKVLPDVTLRWRDVWVGAIVTAVLFVAGESLISLYISKAGVASAYGAAGSLLVTLLWIYYSATIFLFGAEYTRVVATGARTTAPAQVRRLSDCPAGSDPRGTATAG
jgi:membrane protein